MSGPAVIRHLISHDANVLAYLAAAGIPASQRETNIAVGNRASNSTLPAITIKSISGTDYVTVLVGSRRMRTQRVQVTVHCKSGKQQQALLALVLAACPDTKGTLNGVHVDSILPDFEGPDLSDPDEEIYEQSRDFMVSWYPPTA